MNNILQKKPIIIIDGSLYLYASYYGFSHFVSTSGHPFGAIYGVLKIIENIFKKYYTSDKLIIIFDSSQKTFRNHLFPEYKKNRPSMPKKLAIQIPILLKILKKIGIKVFTVPGIEADDLIGSISHKLEKKGENILIVSHDKDMLQLVTKNIYIFHKKHNYIITPKEIKKKYGIKPIEFIDFLALTGDISDNIPGIPKIGIKTALFLLHEFCNIKNIYLNIQKISNLPLRNATNIAYQLKNYKDVAFLSYKLAKIQLNVPIKIKSKEIFFPNTFSKNWFYILKNDYFTL